jgi:Ca2+-binding RTX toxin-like protein
VSARARLDSSVTGDCADGGAAFTLTDHTIDIHLSFGVGAVCVRSGGMPPIRHPMNTQSAFHTYRLDVQRQHVRLSVDGVTVVTFDAARSNSFIGAWIEMLSVGDAITHWDFLSFDTTPSLPACTITGTAASEVLTGTAGRDVICARDGHDIVRGLGGDDVLIGGFGDDQLYGGTGRDVLLGHDGFDFLQGDGADDTLYGGPGDDTFHATRPYASSGDVDDGTDVMVGGVGSDTAEYGRRLTPVRVTLDDLANDGAPGENDRAGVIQWQTVTWPDVENVTGGAAGDTVVGSIIDNVLVGGAGPDTVRGLGGNDTIDVLDGGSGDTVNAGSGQDHCVADPGDSLTSCETG